MRKRIWYSPPAFALRSDTAIFAQSVAKNFRIVNENRKFSAKKAYCRLFLRRGFVNDSAPVIVSLFLTQASM